MKAEKRDRRERRELYRTEYATNNPHGPMESWRWGCVGVTVVCLGVVAALGLGADKALEALVDNDSEYLLDKGVLAQLDKDGFPRESVELVDANETSMTAHISDGGCEFSVTGLPDVQVEQVLDVSNYTILDVNGVALPAVYQSYDDVLATARTSGMCD